MRNKIVMSVLSISLLLTMVMSLSKISMYHEDGTTNGIVTEIVRSHTNEGLFYDRNGIEITSDDPESTVSIVNYPSFNTIIGYNDPTYGTNYLRSLYASYLFNPDKNDNGTDITLTLDIPLQNYCENILGNNVGSIVVMKDDGAILSFLSNNSIPLDLDHLDEYMETTKDIPGSQLRVGLEGDNDAPGSTFKVITLLAALQKAEEENLPLSWFIYNDTGEYRTQTAAFHNYGNYSYGTIEYILGLKNSVNTYFANLACQTGFNKMKEVTEQLGYNQVISCDFGEIYSTFDFNDYTENDLAQLGYGQGKQTTSAMFQCLLMQTLANKGYQHEPYMVQTIHTKREINHQDTILRIVDISDYVYSELQNAMYETAKSYGLCENDRIIYAKTGTAQTNTSRLHTYLVGYRESDHISFCISINEGNSSRDLYPIALNLNNYLDTQNYEVTNE